MMVLQPVAQLVQMLFVSFRNQTRILKRKSRRRERAHRADIDGVERVIVVEALAGMRSQHGITAAIDETQARRRARPPGKNGCTGSRECSARHQA